MNTIFFFKKKLVVLRSFLKFMTSITSGDFLSTLLNVAFCAPNSPNEFWYREMFVRSNSPISRNYSKKMFNKFWCRGRLIRLMKKMRR